MAGIDETIVREYFESNGFLVRQLRKYTVQSRTKRLEEEIDLAVVNPAYRRSNEQPGFLLFAADLKLIQRAIVSVKAWHSTRFTPSTLRSSSEIFKFLEKDVLKKAEELFALDEELDPEQGPFAKILVLPGLPTHEPHRSQSINLLREHGVDGILSFRSMLHDLVTKVENNYNYSKSDLLQLLRILKNYDMIKSPQMELFAENDPRRRRGRASG
ncbi:MAG: hypothetical protein ACFB20_10405 [Opitutales bacterium]